MAFIRDYATGSLVRGIGKITRVCQDTAWIRRKRKGREWHEARLHGRREDVKEDRPTPLNSPLATKMAERPGESEVVAHVFDSLEAVA